MEPIALEELLLEEEESTETPSGVRERAHVQGDKKKLTETCKLISGRYMEAAYPSTPALVFHSQSEDQQPTADMGWALKKTKKSVHFTTNVRQFKERTLGINQRLRMQQHE